MDEYINNIYDSTCDVLNSFNNIFTDILNNIELDFNNVFSSTSDTHQ